MLRLVYSSVQTRALEAAAFEELCRKASLKNRGMQVSGMLLCNGKEYLQCLEGPTDKVSTIYAAIVEDPRHTDIRLVFHQAVDTRLFEGWHMAGLWKPEQLWQSGVRLPYSMLDPYFQRPWHVLGSAAADLLFECASIKANLERGGQQDLLKAIVLTSTT